jgi:electron transfer flavoprotein alpha subunit
VRPTYAGNALATVKSADAIKVITVYATAFAAAEQGGAATIETIAASPHAGLSKLVGRELTKSTRPS